MRRTKETLSAQEGYKLRVVKDYAEELDRLRESLAELEGQTIGSPKLDGMPHGGSQSDAMAGRLIRKQRLEERVRDAERQLRRAINTAKRVIAPLPARMRLFYEAYYIEGYKLEDACSYARVCIRTGNTYVRIANQRQQDCEQ